MMNFVARVVAGCCAVLLLSAASSAAEFGFPQRAFFDKHCSDCHDAAAKEGGLDLAVLSRDLDDSETLRRWVRVYDRLADGEMPPKQSPQPDAAAKKAFLASLAPSLAAADRAQREVIYRRLNRIEYENTIRDLFRVRAEVAAMLPEDANAHGFDNIGEALGASTELIEAYLRAADVAIDMVLGQEQPPRVIKHLTFTDGFRTRSNARAWFIIFPTSKVPTCGISPLRLRELIAFASEPAPIAARSRSRWKSAPATFIRAIAAGTPSATSMCSQS